MTRHAPLALDPDQFRAIGHRLVDDLARRLAAIPHGPVTRDERPSAVRAALRADAPLPEQGRDAGDILTDATEALFAHSLFNAHPRFWGYITSSPAPIGMLGDLLAAALNQNVGAWNLAPAATEIERQVVRWIAEFIGYPTSASGLLVSGGNMASLVCVLAARAARAPWNVRQDGAAGADRPRLRAYASRETHTWLQKAADMMGIGTDAVRWIGTDRTLRLNVDALAQAIATDRAAGDVPFLVVGTAGSVSTGAVDPLGAIADLCRRHGLWFHVDGAYGGLAASVADAPADLRALSEADSVAVDPHKWLYAPLEAGCALIRDVDAHRAAFSYHPPYYHFDEHATNFLDFGPQNSRGFRALKVWLAFQHAGAAGHRQMIADDIRLAGILSEALATEPECEVITRDLSIVTFRYVPAELAPLAADPPVAAYLDALNRGLLDALQRGGEVFVSNAVVGERYLLRACIVNFHSTEADVRALPGIVRRAGAVVDAALRPATLASAHRRAPAGLGSR